MMEDQDNWQEGRNPTYKTTREGNKLREDETSTINKIDYNSITPQEGIRLEQEYAENSHQTDNFQRQFEDSFSDIRTAELEVKNGLPEKYVLDEPVPIGSKGFKVDKEKSRNPIYYNIKSYINEFYCPPDKEVLKSGEFMQGDDFRFIAEPRRKKNCWVRVGLWIGVNLTVLGVIAMMVGNLTPPRQTVVWQMQGYTILDRWAVAFNNRLIVCQLTGLASFTCGIVVVICSLLLSSLETAQRRPTFYVMGASLMPENMVGNPLTEPWTMHRIPISGTIKGVQPTFIASQY